MKLGKEQVLILRYLAWHSANTTKVIQCDNSVQFIRFQWLSAAFVIKAALEWSKSQNRLVVNHSADILDRFIWWAFFVSIGNVTIYHIVWYYKGHIVVIWFTLWHNYTTQHKIKCYPWVRIVFGFRHTCGKHFWRYHSSSSVKQLMFMCNCEEFLSGSLQITDCGTQINPALTVSNIDRRLVNQWWS